MSDENILLKENLGTRRIPKLRMANFPSADEIVRQGFWPQFNEQFVPHGIIARH